MGRRISRGFTLVELLVVITIIGALTALLLPAIGAAREAARRAQCTNNQNQLAAALITYDTNQQRFPGYWSPHPAQAEGSGGMGMTWISSILPYIEQQQLYDAAYGPGTAADYLAGASIPYISSLICPSDPPETKEGGPNSYVINTGRWDSQAPRAAAQARNAMPPDWRGNGVSMVRFPASIRKANQTMDQSQTAATIVDGPSNTMLISENIHAGPWWVAKGPTAGGNWNIWVERAVGMTWEPALDPTNPQRPANPIRHINGGRNAVLSQGQQIQDMNFARPASNHTGSVLAAMADRSVRTISEEIDYKVYCLLMTSETNRIGTPGGLGGIPADAAWLGQPLDQADIK